MRSRILMSTSVVALLLAGCKAGVKTIPPDMDAGPTDTYVPPSRDARDAITPDIPKVTPDAACAAESAGAEAV